MKLYILSVLILLSSNLTWGQTQSGEITYKVSPPQSIKEFIDTTGRDAQFKQWIVQKYENLIKAAPHLNYTLRFNDDEAIFSRPETMTNDNGTNLEETVQTSGGNGLFYSDNKQRINLRQIKSYGQKWLIKTPIDQLQWHIKPQTKTIQGYTCQKATAESDYLNVIKKRTRLVAWFCRDLPFQYGPKGITGLPGMILELTYNHYTFYADNINLKKTPKNINKPTKGTTVSPEKYYEIVKEHSPARPSDD